MIEAVMNGLTPSITMERFESPPPENTFRSPKNWLFWKNCSRTARSTPGLGTAVSARQTMSGCELLYQQFIPNDGDFRIHVVGGKAVCAYKRVPLGDSFKANVSQGGSMEKVTDAALLQQIFLMAEKVAASFIGCEIVGVDLMQDKNTGDLYFIETNEIPGTKQVKEVTGVDISDVMAEYFESVVRNQNVLG